MHARGGVRSSRRPSHTTGRAWTSSICGGCSRTETMITGSRSETPALSPNPKPRREGRTRKPKPQCSRNPWPEICSEASPRETLKTPLFLEPVIPIFRQSTCAPAGPKVFGRSISTPAHSWLRLCFCSPHFRLFSHSPAPVMCSFWDNRLPPSPWHA